MKIQRLVIVLACAFFLVGSTSCSVFASRKSGCPSNGKNVGAEKVNEQLDGGKKAPKAKKFRA